MESWFTRRERYLEKVPDVRPGESSMLRLTVARY